MHPAATVNTVDGIRHAGWDDSGVPRGDGPAAAAAEEDTL